MNIRLRCRPAVLFCFAFLRIVFSFVGGDYCTNTFLSVYHTLVVFMAHFTVLYFYWSLHQLKSWSVILTDTSWYASILHEKCWDSAP